jgi:hypothetical protein
MERSRVTGYREVTTLMFVMSAVDSLSYSNHKFSLSTVANHGQPRYKWWISSLTIALQPYIVLGYKMDIHPDPRPNAYMDVSWMDIKNQGRKRQTATPLHALKHKQKKSCTHQYPWYTHVWHMVAMSVERALQLYIIHGCMMDIKNQRRKRQTATPLEIPACWG